MSNPQLLATSAPATITAETVLKVAQADAEKAYGKLSHYRIEISLEPDGWHVDYRLKGLLMKGGGPHYVISAETGEIVSKLYYQ